MLSCQQVDFDQWRVRTTAYFFTMLIGLFSFPFLIFQIPLLAEAFVHTRPTGYDRAGKVRFMNSAVEIDNLYRKRKEERATRRAMAALGEGLPLSLRERFHFAWNDLLDGNWSQLCAATVGNHTSNHSQLTAKDIGKTSDGALMSKDDQQEGGREFMI